MLTIVSNAVIKATSRGGAVRFRAALSYTVLHADSSRVILYGCLLILFDINSGTKKKFRGTSRYLPCHNVRI